MKFTATVFALAASLALVGAQDLSGIPDCAIPCFAAALSGSGCSASDVKCQCTTGQKAITDSVTACAPARCSADDLAKLAPAANAICAKAGITVSATASGAAATNNLTATASGARTASGSATGSGAGAAQTKNAAAANAVGIGAVAAVGFAAVLGL